MPMHSECQFMQNANSMPIRNLISCCQENIKILHNPNPCSKFMPLIEYQFMWLISSSTQIHNIASFLLCFLGLPIGLYNLGCSGLEWSVITQYSRLFTVGVCSVHKLHWLHPLSVVDAYNLQDFDSYLLLMHEHKTNQSTTILASASM